MVGVKRAAAEHHVVEYNSESLGNEFLRGVRIKSVCAGEVFISCFDIGCLRAVELFLDSGQRGFNKIVRDFHDVDRGRRILKD